MTTTRTNKKTTCTFTCQMSRFRRLVVRFHHAHVIPSFLLDVVVRLYLAIVNSDCSHNYCKLHIAKTGSFRCCPYSFLGSTASCSSTLSCRVRGIRDHVVSLPLRVVAWLGEGCRLCVCPSGPEEKSALRGQEPKRVVDLVQRMSGR